MQSIGEVSFFPLASVYQYIILCEIYISYLKVVFCAEIGYTTIQESITFYNFEPESQKFWSTALMHCTKQGNNPGIKNL